MLSPEIGGVPALHPTLDDVFHLWWDGLLDVKAGIVVVIYLVCFMVFFALAGNMATMMHPDGGAVVYVSLFWALPLLCIVLSTREYKFLKRDKKNIEKKESNINFLKLLYIIIGLITIIEGLALLVFQDLIVTKIFEYLSLASIYRGQFLTAFTVISVLLIGIGIFIIGLWLNLRKMENHNRNLLTISLIFLIAGTITICVSVLGFLLGEAIIPFIYTSYEAQISEYLTLQDVLTLAFIIEIVTLIFTIVYIVSAIGLTMKNSKIWRFSIYYNLIFAWTILGLAVACYLSENSVKEIVKNREI